MLGCVFLPSRGEIIFSRHVASSLIVNIDIGGRGDSVAVGCCNLFTAYRLRAALCHEFVRLTEWSPGHLYCYVLVDGHGFSEWLKERLVLDSVGVDRACSVAA